MPLGRPTVEFDRSKLMIRIEVTLNADPTAISPVVEGIMEMARRLECAAGKEFEIETSLREAQRHRPRLQERSHQESPMLRRLR
jgi:hypothetical protein